MTKARVITDDKVDSTITTSSSNPVASSAIYEVIETIDETLGGKIDVDQGSENTGKLLKVGSSGSVVLSNPAQVNGVSLSGNKSSEDLGIVENMTKAEYDALSEEEKNSGKLFCTTDDATSLSYSGLSDKPKINGVIIDGSKSSEELGIVVNLTKAEYDALPTEEKNSGKLFCTIDE